MARIDDLMEKELVLVGDKPPDTAKREVKKAYSEKISAGAAAAIAADLRAKGLHGAHPTEPGVVKGSGAERRMAGGIGAKKVDVTWATEESGLLLGISVKSINFRDGRTKNFQKNLTKRRGDMLFEAVTLHRRFPYPILGGLLFLDKDAANDSTTKRNSTFGNAHQRLRLFTGRNDPAGRDEQFERFFVSLLVAGATHCNYATYAIGDPINPVSLDDALNQLIEMVAVRNPDFYLYESGRLVKT